jgi:hypothetical protein
MRGSTKRQSAEPYADFAEGLLGGGVVEHDVLAVLA